MVKDVVEHEIPKKEIIEIEITPSNDLRSYHVSSEKIAKKLGFKAKRSINDAVQDLCKAFKGGKLPNSFEDSRYYNVKRLKEIGFT